jgi:hypothetical protein
LIEYNKDLKSDSIKSQIVYGYYHDDKSSYELSRELEIPARTIQNFLAKDTHKAWHLENEEWVDKLKMGDYQAVDCPTPEHQIGIWPPYKPEKSKGSLHVTDAYGADVEFKFDKPKVCKEDNSRILLISDMHIPYHHKDTIKFLQHLKDKYNPTRIICMGDELDKHALSFHDSDPDLPSAGDELKLALPVIAKLKEMFPVMDILESNHGSLAYRKAHAHGIPRHYLKTYNDVLGVDDNWKWHYDLTIELPNGNKCYFHHGKSANVSKTSQTMSMCAVQGHYHETFKVEYWGNPNGLYWGLQTGCLIDDKAYAFNYNNCNLKRPIIGTAMIIDSIPVLEPLVMAEYGNWINR